MTEPKTITIDDEKYIRESDVQQGQGVTNTNGMVYAIVCCERSGIFAGYIESQGVYQISLVNARRIKYWSGAASITQLALQGTGKPNDCLFSLTHDVALLDVCSITNCTEKGMKSIQAVKDWVK